MNSLDNLNGEYDDCNNNYDSSMNLAGFCEMNDDNKYVNLGLSLSRFVKLSIFTIAFIIICSRLVPF